MRRRRLLEGLGGASVVGLGGCLRLSSTDSTATTGTTASATTADDATTARTTTADETDQDDGAEEADDYAYPTGLDEEGVYAYLVDNHANTLSDTSFRERWTVANKTEGETMESEQSVVEDGRALTERGVGVGLQVFYDADGGYWREELGDDATYGEDRRAFEFQWVSKARELRSLFLAGDWDAPTRADGGFEITAAGTDNVTSLREEFEAESVERFEASGVVSPDGVVTELTAEFEFVHEREERLFEVRVRHRADDVGEVSLSEPSWLGTARERAPEVDVRVDDASEFIVFDHQGGNPIEPDTNVVVYDRGEPGGNWGYRQNDAPFEPGETVYLWMDKDDRLQWQRGSRPSVADPQSLDRPLAFWMHRHGAEYFGNVEL